MARRAERVVCSNHFHDRLWERFGLRMPAFVSLDMEREIEAQVKSEPPAAGQDRVLFDCTFLGICFTAVFNPATNLVVTAVHPPGMKKNRKKALKKRDIWKNTRQKLDDEFHERRKVAKHIARRKGWKWTE